MYHVSASETDASRIRESTALVTKKKKKKKKMRLVKVAALDRIAASTSQLTVEAVAEFNRTCERKKKRVTLQTSETLFYKEMNLRDM